MTPPLPPFSRGRFALLVVATTISCHLFEAARAIRRAWRLLRELSNPPDYVNLNDSDRRRRLTLDEWNR